MAATADVERVRAALVLASEIGPYFAVEFSAAQGKWHTVADLWAEPGCLSERVITARDYLSSRTDSKIDMRSCASISSLGFVSRLVAPALATACLAGMVPRLDPQQISWRPVVGGPVPIALTVMDGVAVGTAAEAAVELERAVLLPCVAPVLASYGRQFQLSPQVLRGNLGSALAGAATMLIRARVALGIDPVEVVAAMLAQPLLLDMGHYERPFHDRAERFYLRHNCCLFYRIPGGGTCGDCVLVPETARLDIWRAALETAGDATGFADD